jgi:cytochrome d ubiquinol oxidase subunit I
VGAVSGTILSFLLGLLWPRFMEYAGGIIGMPFSMEGFAFFIEAIFLGIYLYSWEKISPRAHWLSGIPVAIAGALSGIFVVSANAWMNSPAGFDIVDGEVRNVDPVAAMLNSAWPQQALHMTLAAYTATTFGVAGVYAWGMLRGRGTAYHEAALKLAMGVGVVVSILQAISGDISAHWVAHNQPVKLAAMEGLFETTERAPLTIGGIPDPESRTTRWGIEIPGGLSFLADRDINAEIQGLNDFPMDEQPDPRPVHLAFQTMVGIGTMLIVGSVTFWFVAWRRRAVRPGPWILRGLVLLAPLGFVAIEAGWIVTEVGRQPWVIQGVMRTEDAVTQVPNQFISLWGFTIIYGLLGVTLVWLLLLLAKKTPPIEARDAEVAHVS